jgi:cobalt-zinc-cadmium efflux system membrane fusion protein
VIKALLKAPGEAVDPTQPAVVLATRSSGEITLTVSGADARSVQPGDAVTIATLGPVRRSGSGQVRSVVAALDPTTQATTIVAGGVPPLAVSGEAVDATIAVAKRAGVLIPTSAIVEDPGSGKLLVFVRNENTSAGAKFAAREITAGSGDDVRTIVRSGLRAGERVAVQGAFDLLAPSGGN